jgi:GntR family transcriptional regulator
MEFQEDRPRWRQVHEMITARIASGEYPAGARVPSVVQIQAEFGIAAATAQKVLKQLRADGLTKTEPGMGSYVSRKPAEE